MAKNEFSYIDKLVHTIGESKYEDFYKNNLKTEEAKAYFYEKYLLPLRERNKSYKSPFFASIDTGIVRGLSSGHTKNPSNTSIKDTKSPKLSGIHQDFISRLEALEKLKVDSPVKTKKKKNVKRKTDRESSKSLIEYLKTHPACTLLELVRVADRSIDSVKRQLKNYEKVGLCVCSMTGLWSLKKEPKNQRGTIVSRHHQIVNKAALEGHRSSLEMNGRCDECGCNCRYVWFYSALNIKLCSSCKSKKLSGRLPERAIIKIRKK